MKFSSVEKKIFTTSFIRPHLDYCDVIYDKIFDESWHKKLESAKYNAALAITGAIRGTNTEKLLSGHGTRIFAKQT